MEVNESFNGSLTKPWRKQKYYTKKKKYLIVLSWTQDNISTSMHNAYTRRISGALCAVLFAITEAVT